MAKTLDITRDCCPMTFVKVKLALAKLQSGEELDVLLNKGEPLNNVPRTAASRGTRCFPFAKRADSTTCSSVRHESREHSNNPRHRCGTWPNRFPVFASAPARCAG